MIKSINQAMNRSVHLANTIRFSYFSDDEDDDKVVCVLGGDFPPI